MEKLFIDKEYTQQVLNFNFSTNMLFKCTKKEYAEDLLNGNVFFNMPEKWIEMEEKNTQKGQGDSLEGVCLVTDKSDCSEFILNLKLNKNFEYFEKDNKLYFRNKNVKKIYCFCMYGLKDTSFNEKFEDRFGKINFCSRIDKSYFNDFTELNSEKEFLNLPVAERPAVVFIFNPHSFFERIREALIKIGFSKDEIIISPVDYVDRKKNAIVLLPYSKELLLKDKCFEYQSEVRVIINSNKKKYLELIKNNYQKVNIGKIDDIACIYDYYFQDLILMKDGNKILFNLPFPEKIPLEKLTLRKLLAIYVQTFNDRLPEAMPAETRKEITDAIEEIAERKYNFRLSVENGKISIYGFSGDINDILDK